MTTARNKSTGPLEKALGHTFKDRGLLRQALTHPSLEGEPNYQRLEFLGDRVIGLAAGNLVYRTFPGEREGQLSRRYAALVRRETLAQVAGTLNLGAHIRMTDTAARAGGRTNPSLLSDVVEALVGALYIEAGLEAADTFVTTALARFLEGEDAPKDPKSALQEWAQGRGRPLPDYTVTGSEGPDHAPRFTVSVSVEGAGTATREGISKQDAQTKAAEALLKKIQKAKQT